MSLQKNLQNVQFQHPIVEDNDKRYNSNIIVVWTLIVKALDLALCPSFNEAFVNIYPSMECFISSIATEDNLWRLQIEEDAKIFLQPWHQLY
jgi:hypothetical protein